MKDVIVNYQTAKNELLAAREKKDITAEKTAAKAFHKAEKELMAYNVEKETEE